MRGTWGALLLMLAWAVPAAAGEDAAAPADRAPAVILKFDDVIDKPSPRWERTLAYLEKENIPVALGIIGYSLEADRPEYFAWLQAQAAGGRVEFWNHGYSNRTSPHEPAEFECGSADEQAGRIGRTQALAKEKAGLTLAVFGPNWSGTTPNTFSALKRFPEIKSVFFYGPRPEDKALHGKYVFPRLIELEYPVHNPDAAQFKDRYPTVRDQPLLVLQGHPASWDDRRWAEVAEVLAFLKAKGCTFTTPSKWLAANPPAEP